MVIKLPEGILSPTEIVIVISPHHLMIVFRHPHAQIELSPMNCSCELSM